MIIDDAVCLPDGNEIVLKVIEDQFCPCDHLCIWQGELQIMLEVANSAGEKRLVSVGSESFDVTDPIFENTKTASYTYRYENDLALPLCDGDFDPNKVTVALSIVEE